MFIYVNIYGHNIYIYEYILMTGFEGALFPYLFLSLFLCLSVSLYSHTHRSFKANHSSAGN